MDRLTLATIFLTLTRHSEAIGGLFLLRLSGAPWTGDCSSRPAVTLDFLTTKSGSWKSIFKVMNK